jgi:hypothetical protein
VRRAGASRIFACLCAVEVAMGAVLAGIYKAPGLHWALLAASTRVVLVAGALGLVASGWLLGR